MQHYDYERIRSFIGRHGIVIEAVLSRVFCDGKPARNLIAHMKEKGWIMACSQGLGGLAYYQLSRTSARRAGIPENRARQIEPAELRRRLAVLWFCYMNDARRYPLEPWQALDVLEAAAPIAGWRQMIHCQDRGDKARVYWLYVPAHETFPSRVRDHVRKKLSQLEDHPELNLRLRARSYAVAVVGGTKKRMDDLRVVFKDARLYERALVTVEYAPEPAHIKEALHAERPSR